MNQDGSFILGILVVIAVGVGIFALQQKPTTPPPEGGRLTGVRNPVPLHIRFQDEGRVLLVTNRSDKHLHAIRIWGGGNGGEIATLLPHATQELVGSPPVAEWNDRKQQSGFYLFARCDGYDD